MLPPPHVIPGGGIADGPIRTAMNIYVIDDMTRQPIAGATVGVGGVQGWTDATGLYIATGVSGPQTIYAKATGYSRAAWFGVDGANVTIDLQPMSPSIPPVPSANVSGSVLGLDAIAVPSGHVKSVRVGYSFVDSLGAQNNPPQPNPTYGCDVMTGPCTFSFRTHVGPVALAAVIYDYDPNAHTFAVVAWAGVRRLTVVDGVDQTGVDLDIIPSTSYVPLTIDFGAPPAGFTASANPALDLGADGVLSLPPLTPAAPTYQAPSLATVSGTSYRLAASAYRSVSSGDTSQTFVTRRGLAGPTLPVGEWLDAPSGYMVSSPAVSWTHNPNAKIEGCEYSNADGSVDVLVFDASSSIVIPSPIRLPTQASGWLKAIGGTFDPQSFGFDADRDAMPTRSIHYADF